MWGLLVVVSFLRRVNALFRHADADALLLGAALLDAAVVSVLFVVVAPNGSLGAVATAIAFGVSVCWSSNTVAHNHLHRPLFGSRVLNRCLSLVLTVILGVPQSIWRARHFWHHAGEPAGQGLPPFRGETVLEMSLVLGLWAGLLHALPRVFWLSYVPGYALGMALCQLQGRMEHTLPEGPSRGISYYGRIHNLLWFNDGYHAEHHLFPTEHWTRLPGRRGASSLPESQRPPLARFLESSGRPGEGLRASALAALERLALASEGLQDFMLRTHEAAFRRLLPASVAAPRIGVIGGGLFPRTAIVLKRIFPESEIVVIDSSEEHVATAREFLSRRGASLIGSLGAPAGEVRGISFRAERFRAESAAFDLVVAPLAFVGERSELSRVSAREGVVTHDWLWRGTGEKTAVVSVLLLKRLNWFPRAR